MEKIVYPEVCPLCRKKIGNIDIEAEYVYGGASNQKFYRCEHCSVAFLYPQLSKEEAEDFYSREFEKFMEKRAGKDFDWSGPEAHIKSNEKQYLRRFRFFKEMLSPGKSILEIGCSSGFMLLPLKDKGMEVAGVEPSSGFTSFLKKQGVQVFESIDDVIELEKKFDVVIHFFVLEHVIDPIGFLKNALDSVNPGGNMVFEVPNRNDPLISIYNNPAFNRFYWSMAHNYYFDRTSLEYVLHRITDQCNIQFEIIPDQRYDLSNHMVWALEGKPGGQSKYSCFFTSELERTYMESMIKTGHCDTLVAKIHKGEK